MTDKELIARLREAVNGEHDMTPHGADCLQAAARIEALTEQLKTVLDREAATHFRHDAKTDELEAKLAKAVEGQKIKALEQILEERGAVFDAMVDAAEDAAGKDVSFNVVVGRALRAAIAEIKGESHDPAA